MMRMEYRILAAVALLLGLAARPAAGLDERLAPLAPYVGHCFTAVMSPPGVEPAVTDVQLWEEILGGKAVRITHSVNGGDYGGESILTWDPSRRSIAYWYVTTADFHTVGTLVAAGDSLMTHEQVFGDAGEITEVAGVWRRDADGLTVRSRMMAAGKWLPARVTKYRESPDAVPMFR